MKNLIGIALFIVAGAAFGQRPAQPELRFVEIPAAVRGNFAGDRFSYQEAGPASAPVTDSTAAPG